MGIFTNEKMKKLEKYFNDDIKKSIVGYALENDKIYVGYENGDQSIYPNIQHNIDILDRKITKSIYDTYENAKILKKEVIVSNSIAIALLLFMAIVVKDMPLLLIIYSILTFPSCLFSYIGADLVYKRAFQEKYLLENIDLLNEIMTADKIISLDIAQINSYLYNNSKIGPGNIRIFAASSKTLVKNINEVKHGK